MDAGWDELRQLDTFAFLNFLDKFFARKGELFKYAPKIKVQQLLFEAGAISYSTFEILRTILRTSFDPGQDPLPQLARAEVRNAYQNLRKGKTQEGVSAEVGRVKQRAKEDIIQKVLMPIGKKWNIAISPKGSGPVVYQSKSGLTIFLLCHYWHHLPQKNVKQVHRGMVSVDYSIDSNKNLQVTRAKLMLYPIENQQFFDAVLLCDAPVLAEDILFLSFVDADRPHIKSMFVLKIGKDKDPAHWAVLSGTYASITRRSPSVPIAGTLILQQTQQLMTLHQRAGSLPDESIHQELYQVVQTAQTSAIIYHYLYRGRLTGEEQVWHQLEDISASAREIHLLERYAGRYKGTYFRKQKSEQILRHDRVEQFILRIEPNGDATMKVSGMEPYHGRIRVILMKNDALIGYFDFLPGVKIYRFTIYFNKEFKGNTLYAVYAGIERETPYVPIAGRMILEKLDHTAEQISDEEYIHSTTDIESFVKNPENRQLVKVLSGQSDQEFDYVETLPTPKPAMMEGVTDEQPYHGNYFCYSLSTKQAVIYRIPLRIHKNGQVEMRTRDLNKTTSHKGFAIYNEINRLSLYLGRANHPKSYFHLLFAMGNINVDEARYFFGVSSKFDKQGSPSGRVEVLVKAAGSYEEQISKSFPLYSEEFHHEDIRTNGLLSFLSGKDNRIVVAKKTPNAELTRNADAAQYFYAACYLCNRAATTSDYSRSLQYLYQAYLHGFGKNSDELQLLKTEQAATYQKALRLKLSAKPDHSDLPTMTFAELFDKMEQSGQPSLMEE